MYGVCEITMRTLSYRGCLHVLAHLASTFPAGMTTNLSCCVCFRVYYLVPNIFRAPVHHPRWDSEEFFKAVALFNDIEMLF